MKISKVQTQVVRLPADEALAGGPVTPGATRDMVTLRVGTDAGIEGIGYTFFGAALTGALKAAVDAFASLAVGESFTGTVTFRSCGGHKQTTATVLWRSESPVIATVDSITGQVIGRGPGQTRILGRDTKYGFDHGISVTVRTP